MNKQNALQTALSAVDQDYVVALRREIHEYPEIGFDCPKTLAVVRRELDKLNIPYTEELGKSAIVAALRPDKAHYTIGIRADMDALPITEATGLDYASKIDGQMHACGHDMHTRRNVSSSASKRYSSTSALCSSPCFTSRPM